MLQDQVYKALAHDATIHPVSRVQMFLELSCLNDLGAVVGLDNRESLLLLRQGQLIKLGSLGGRMVRACDINNRNHVVGISSTRSQDLIGRAMGSYQGIVRKWGKLGDILVAMAPGEPRSVEPFLWEDGTMLKLNDLIPEDSGWVLDSAISINDLDQIVGYGTFHGGYRGFLLTPIRSPEKREE